MYRDDLTALAERQSALTAEVARATRELGETTQLLTEARRRASLPVLDNIRVASPCKASWDAMTGDDRVRHCKQCNKNVYNLSAMTRDQAQSLIARTEDELCGRYFRRADGTILTADCPVGVRRRRRVVVLATGIVTVVIGAVGAVGAVASKTMEEHTLGKMSFVETSPPAEVHLDPDLQISTNPIHGATTHHDVPR
jgi:hypothetical protein